MEYIFISAGGALNRRYFTILVKDIAEIGDFLQLTLSKAGVEGKVHQNRINDFAFKGLLFKDVVGKVVVAQKGMEVGKIADMYIDPEGLPHTQRSHRNRRNLW